MLNLFLIVLSIYFCFGLYVSFISFCFDKIKYHDFSFIIDILAIVILWPIVIHSALIFFFTTDVEEIKKEIDPELERIKIMHRRY